MRCLKITLLCIIFQMGFHTQAAENTYWQSLAVEMNAQLGEAVNFYQQGQPQEAGRAVIQAYFGIFEGQKVEAAMRMELGAKYTYLVEKNFSGLRKSIKNGVETSVFSEQVEVLKHILIQDTQKLDSAAISPSVFNTGE